MSSDEKPSVPMAPLNREQMRRYEELAPGALGKRDAAFYAGEINTGLQIIAMGAIPIIGIARFGWSPMNWLIFIIFGAWLGLVIDCIKLFFLHRQIKRYATERADDQFVSAVTDALSTGKTEIPAAYSGGTYRPKRGLFIELVFMPISTLLIFVAAGGSMNTDWRSVFEQPYFVPTLLGLALLQFLITAWEIIHTRKQTEAGHAPIVKVFLGGRGACLFLLMFAVLIATDGGDAENPTNRFRLAVYIINGIIVLLGLLSLWGLWLMRRESKMLRSHIEQKRGR